MIFKEADILLVSFAVVSKSCLYSPIQVSILLFSIRYGNYAIDCYFNVFVLSLSKEH
nr:hypothetical protein BN993_06500 [Virgibacillus halodenitrificans]